MKKIKMAVWITLFIIILNIGVDLLSARLADYYSLDDNFKQGIQADTQNYVTIDQMPDYLIKAVVAIEDKRFYRHSGYDIIGIARALIENIRYGKMVQGGSTITQQLIKNRLLSSEKTFSRKIKEILLAIELEKQYDKDDIMEMYLNVIYFGSGAYGVEQASKIYFNKDVRQLTLEECAMLAGIIQAPSVYNPNQNYQKAKVRQQIILDLMGEAENI